MAHHSNELLLVTFALNWAANFCGWDYQEVG
jgi:hypothetical protein